MKNKSIGLIIKQKKYLENPTPRKKRKKRKTPQNVIRQNLFAMIHSELVIRYLTLCTLWANPADDKSMLFLQEKRPVMFYRISELMLAT